MRKKTKSKVFRVQAFDIDGFMFCDYSTIDGLTDGKEDLDFFLQRFSALLHKHLKETPERFGYQHDV